MFLTLLKNFHLDWHTGTGYNHSIQVKSTSVSL